MTTTIPDFANADQLLMQVMRGEITYEEVVERQKHLEYYEAIKLQMGLLILSSLFQGIKKAVKGFEEEDHETITN